MFLFAPGVLPSIRLAHTKYGFFPVRRFRVKTSCEVFVASPLFITTLSEKETLPVTLTSEESVYVLLAALFDGRGTQPAAYATGVLLRTASPWPEDRLYVSEARGQIEQSTPSIPSCGPMRTMSNLLRAGPIAF